MYLQQTKTELIRYEIKNNLSEFQQIFESQNWAEIDNRLV